LSNKITFEACIDSVASAIAAQEGDADRVELCADLLEGGITPGAGTIQLVRQRLTIPLHLLIRPRGGDFCYTDDEFAVMQLDIEQARTLGADGVVLGLLHPDGSIDRERTAVLVEHARPLSVTFHRAFDMARDPHQSLDTLIDLGIDRLLTSGQEATALAGADLIAALIQQAGDRIAIMAGGGITEQNAAEIVTRAHVRELHATARESITSRMQYRNPRCTMGGALPPEEFSWKVTSAEKVRAILRTFG
jgi:copper homeostasis protein